MPVGLFTTQGLTIYNITEVGGTQTGASSQFIISPNEGNIIFSNRFTADAPTSGDIYTSVSFVDTVGAGDPSNEVLVTIDWDSTTTLTDVNTAGGNYIINLGITYDDTVVVSLAQSTVINLVVQTNGSANWTNSTLNVTQPSDSIANYDQTGVDTVVNVSGVVEATDPVLVTEFTVSTNAGYYYFDDEYLIESILEQNPELDSPGFTIEVTTNSQQDLFGNQIQHLYKVYYEATPGLTEDVNTVITVNAPQPAQYFANFIYNTENVNDSSFNNHSISVDTNIPGQLTLTFSESWASNDTLSTSEYVYVDIEALPGGTGSRSVNITLKDEAYGISRNLDAAGVSQPLVLTQTVTPSISLAIKSANNEFLASGKIVSTPNTTAGLNYLVPPANTTYSTPFYGDVTYELYANVDANVEVADLNSSLFTITQTQSYNANWIVLDPTPGTWEQVGPVGNVWKRKFFIRNNKSGADRTATFSLTHPDDGAVSDTLTVTQDKHYDSSVDTVTARTNYNQGVGVNGSATYGSGITLASNNQGFVKVRIKMSDYEGFGGTGAESPFTLLNDSTVDPGQVDTFMQYPRPRIALQSFSTTTTSLPLSGDDVWASYNTATLAFNTDYDPSDSNNDHQYTATITFNQNDSFSSRTSIFRVFHGQNDTDIADYNNQIVQPGIDGLDAYQINDETDVLDGLEEVSWIYYEAANNLTKTIGIDSSGTNPPIIGLWDIDTSTYTALAAGVLSNGLSYSALAVIQGNYRKTNVTFTPNDPSGSRSVTLGFWVSTANPATDAPNDYITFEQGADSYDPGVYNVTLNYATGSQAINAPEAQTVVVEAFVQDYDQADYNADANEPVVEIVRVENPGPDAVVIPDDTGLIPSFTVAKNTNWPGDNNLATHTITIPFGAYDGVDQVHFEIKAKHQWNEGALFNAILELSKQPQEEIEFDGGVVEFGGGVGSYFEQIETPASGPSFDVAATTHYEHTIKPTVTTNLGATVDDNLYPTDHEYLVFRFLDSSLTSIYNNASPNDVPSMFFGAQVYGYIQEYNQINPRGSEIQSWGAYPNQNFAIGMKAKPNVGNTLLSQAIGVWTGSAAPRTNLIDTSSSENVTNLTGDNLIFTAVGTDGFDWDSLVFDLDSVTNSTHTYKFKIIPNNEATSGEEYGVSFDVQDYETSDGEPHEAGVSTGWYSVPTGLEDSVSLTDLQEGLRFNSDGRVTGILKLNLGQEYFRFFGRDNTRFKVRNLMFWKIKDDPKLRPGESVSASMPSDILMIRQHFDNVNVLFSYAQFGVGPLASGDTAIEDVLVQQPDANGILQYACNSEGATIKPEPNGEESAVLRLYITGTYAPEAYCKKWNAQTGTSEDFDVVSDWVLINEVEQDDPFSGVFHFEVTVKRNNTFVQRELTIGLYQSVPTGDDTAPLDTFTITQQAIQP